MHARPARREARRGSERLLDKRGHLAVVDLGSCGHASLPSSLRAAYTADGDVQGKAEKCCRVRCTQSWSACRAAAKLLGAGVWEWRQGESPTRVRRGRGSTHGESVSKRMPSAPTER